MAHINHRRNVKYVNRLHIEQAIPQVPTNNSFGAFGGTSQQRYMVGLYEISRNLNKKGIVVIHNDPAFELSLSSLYSINPSLLSHPRSSLFLANQHGSLNSFYDVLYGLSASDVLDAIAPIPDNGVNLTEAQSLRSILADYLDIIFYQFSVSSNAFGDFPFNLDLLLELTRMSFVELDSRVLSFLPSNRFNSLSRRLSAPEAQQRAYNAVRSFSHSMGKGLWSERGFSDHSRLSIIQTVLSKGLISIYVPGSRKEVLDYLTVELKALNDRNQPYLLVTSGISINESPDFKKLFLNDHSALPYSTGILSADISSVVNLVGSGNNTSDFSGSAELSAIFSQSQEMFVFQCSSTLAAAPFSQGIGNYYRQVSEHHRNAQREPFHILPSRGQGSAQHEVHQAIVNPEELTSLGDGCMLYGSNIQSPVIVSHFEY